MKRSVVLILCLVLLLAAACGRQEAVSEADMEQPVKFYYCQTGEAETYENETGALAWELRDLGPERLKAAAILELYLKGPETDGLRSPFPSGLEVEETQLQNGILTVTFSEELDKLTGIRKTRAAACLVYTLTEFADIKAVQLDGWESPLTREDFLLSGDILGE